MSADGRATALLTRFWEKRTNGTALRVNSATRVRSSDTAAEREAAFICCGPRLRLCSQSVLRRLHSRDLQAGNPKRRADRRLGGGNRIERRHRRDKNVVYAMRVTGTMTFEEYWADPRFQRKKPNLRGSKKQAFGDNIYSRDPATDRWCQANSHHSLHDGSANPLNVNGRHRNEPDSRQRRFCLLGRLWPASYRKQIPELWPAPRKRLRRPRPQESIFARVC